MLRPPFIPVSASSGTPPGLNLYRRRVGTRPNQMLKEHAGFDESVLLSLL